VAVFPQESRSLSVEVDLVVEMTAINPFDFCDLHAWAAIYLPGAGWIGLDPTSGLMAGEGHIPLAYAAEPTSAAAVTGSFAFTPDPSKANGEKDHEEFSFAMSVQRVVEHTRVTKPYSEG
jgi:transglutaminase-like putative cysteine protease